MPSLFGHAVVALSAAEGFPAPAKSGRIRAWGVLCAVLPDVDVAGFAFGVPYAAFLGHRGFTHSLVFALLTGIGVTRFAFAADWRVPARRWPRLLYFTLITASHPLLDALTNGGRGVALFSPFDLNRYFFAVRPIRVSPLAAAEFLGTEGLRVLASEAVYVALPCALLVLVMRAGRRPRSPGRRRAFLLALLLPTLLALAALARGLAADRGDGVDPAYVYAIRQQPVANDPRHIPTADLPGHRLVLAYPELRSLGLFDRLLTVEPGQQPWSSSFFPTWYGGAAGRWQDSRVTLLFRSLLGFSPPEKDEARALLQSAAKGDPAAEARLYRLSPTEKYDLAAGDYSFKATRDEAGRYGHNRVSGDLGVDFWTGYCDGASDAAVTHGEPFREVEVINPDGYRIRFHPNDVKALLYVASGSAREAGDWFLGSRCNDDTLATHACLDVNPASFVLALLHRIGLAHGSFILDKRTFASVVNVPLIDAEVRVTRPPYPVPAAGFAGAPEIRFLLDVRIALTVASTEATHSGAGEPDPARPELKGAFRRTGVIPERLEYEATLGLSAELLLVGGRWTGESVRNHPDFAWGRRPAAATLKGTRARPAPATSNPYIESPFVEALHARSVSADAEIPVLDQRGRK